MAPASNPRPMRLLRAVARLVKGAYDILASYLLAWVLLLALLAWAFWAALTLIVNIAGFDSSESFWLWVDRVGPLDALTVRLGSFLLLHVLVVIALRRRLRRAQQRIERAANRALARYRRWGARHPAGRTLVGASFTGALTLLLVPFVLQPTLVPLARWGGKAWAARAANLVDGSASAALFESAVGLYRKLLVTPVAGYGVSPDAFERAVRGGSGPGLPLMDRWDPLLWQAAGPDRRGFALLKALVWVESGGRRFAVSRTGCTGLTQFCTRTARSGGFRKVFGVGQVYPCRCDGPCRVPRQLRQELETGDAETIARHAEDFVCDLSDARFDPRKSILAGQLYVRRLGEEFAGNIYLIYVGYNSGPQVARRLWSAIGNAPAAELDALGPHLAAALSPYFGRAADRRARALLQTHLPKLRQAFDAYHEQAGRHLQRSVSPG